MEFKITKEQIKELVYFADLDCGTEYKLKEWFPEAFKTELEVGKWYFIQWDTNKRVLAYFNGQEGNEVTYGFDTFFKWSEKIGLNIEKNDIVTLATDQEVETALINEAKKRGFSKCEMINYKGNRVLFGNQEYTQNSYDGMAGICGIVFSDGIWKELIPTMTKKEAEEKLNCKII